LRLQDTSFSRDGRSLLEITNALAADGWTGQATPLAGGAVRCETCGESTQADQLGDVTMQRVEGASDPDDMAAVVPLECPRCNARDVLVLKYGPEASEADADVLTALSTP
jgi:hypothetical protein